MAEVAALRQALHRMGLSNQAAQYATAGNGMGLDSLNAWRDFHTDDNLDGMAKNFRSPGGTVVQQGNQVRHPGYAISVKTISNLKVMRLALKHFQHIQRTVVAATITTDWIDTWEFLVEYHKEITKQKIDEDDLPKINKKDWATTKEKIMNHFSEIYGKDGIPLAYVIREESDVLPEADDNQVENYQNDHVKELITRAPHTGTTYRADNRTMCRLIKKICIDTTDYDKVSRFTADGRAAWLALIEANCGPQHVDLQATIYESKLLKSHYRGESQRFTFNRLVDIHTNAHKHLAALVAHGYKEMDEGTKIRHLLNAIKSPKLTTVVELVQGNKDFNTFDLVARRIKDTVELQKNKDTQSERSISAVGVANQGGQVAYANVEPDMNVEDKYYPPKEWMKLTPAQRKGVLAKRQKRGGGGGKGDKKVQNAHKKLEKKIAKLTRKIAAMSTDDSDESSDSDSEEPPTKKQKATTNKNNPHLKKKKKDKE